MEVYRNCKITLYVMGIFGVRLYHGFGGARSYIGIDSNVHQHPIPDINRQCDTADMFTETKVEIF